MTSALALAGVLAGWRILRGPRAQDRVDLAKELLRSQLSYVATRTLTELDWRGSVILHGDLQAAVTGLKAAGDGDVAVLGSGDLVQQLMSLDLVDKFRLFIHPLLLGAGKRLFRELDTPRRLHLTASGTTSLGTVVLGYDVLRQR